MKHPAAVFIETPRTRAHGGNKARPQRNGAGCPTEWPHRVQTSGTGAPQDEPRLRASLTGATPRPRTDPASEPDAFPNMARSRKTRPFLDASCPVRSLCVGTSLRESRNTSQGVLENVTGSLGNVTLLPVLSQGVRSWPGNVPQTVSLCGAIPRVRLQGDIARRADATSTPPIHSTCVYPACGLPPPSSLRRDCGDGSRYSVVNVQPPGGPQPDSAADRRGSAAVQTEHAPRAWLAYLGEASIPPETPNLARPRKSVGRITIPPKPAPGSAGRASPAVPEASTHD